MTNFNSKKYYKIIVIVASVIVALGLALGLVSHFAFGGFFQKGSDYSSYQSVVVDYSMIDFKENDVKSLCEEKFSEANLSHSKAIKVQNADNAELVYKFSASADKAQIEKAVNAIKAELEKKTTESGLGGLYNVSYHDGETLVGGGKTLVMASIVVAVAVVFQFVYFCIRYKLTMALTALISNVANVLIFLSLVSITRIPVGSAVITITLAGVLASLIFSTFFFDRMRKNIKLDDLKSATAYEQVDFTAGQVNGSVLKVTAAIAAACLVLGAVVTHITFGGSVFFTTAAAMLALIAVTFVTLFLMPCVYSRFKLCVDKRAEKKSLYAKKHRRLII